MCGVPGFPSHTVFDPHRGRINGKCHTRPRGVDPYGVLTPGYQDGGTLCHSCPYGAFARYSYGIAPRRGRRHGVPNLGSPVRRPRQRSMCGVPGFPSHTIFDPYGGRINGKCYTRPRGVAPYGVLTPGYQDGGTLCHSCPYGAYVLTSLPRGVDPYGVLTPGYQDLTALRSSAPIGAIVLTSYDRC